MGEKTEVFVRRATGLVREMGVGGGFAYNATAVGILLPWTYLAAIYAFPNGDIALGMLTAAICTVFYSATLAMLSSTMPRSGGEYIFQSRLLHGAIGFIFAGNCWIVWQIAMMGSIVWMAAVAGIQPLMVILGVMWNNPALIEVGNFFITPNGMMVLAVIMQIVVFAVLSMGMRWFVRLLWVFWGSVVISCILMISLFALNSNAAFINSFNSFMAYFTTKTPDYYNHVLRTAAEQGVSTAYRHNWFDSIGMGIYGTGIALTWGAVTTLMSGEIKHAQVTKSQIIMVSGGILTAAIFMALIGGSLQHIAGFEFMKAASWGFQTGSIAFPIAPYPAFLASILTNNPLVIILIALGVFFTGLHILHEATIGGTRMSLALSFDRVFPAWVSDVNPRFHTPIKAHLIFFVGGLISSAIYFYVPDAWLYVLSLLVPQLTSFAVSCLVGALYPFHKKEMFNASPIAKYKLGPVPVITLTGLLGTAYLGVVLYYMFTVPALFVVHPASVTFIVSSFVALAVWYLVAKSYQKKKGIEISAAFKEIPPE